MHDLSYSIKENNGRIRKLSEYLLVCKVERYFLQMNTIFCCPVHLFIKNILFIHFYMNWTYVYLLAAREHRLLQ